MWVPVNAAADKCRLRCEGSCWMETVTSAIWKEFVRAGLMTRAPILISRAAFWLVTSSALHAHPERV